MNQPGKMALLNRLTLAPAFWDETAARWSASIPHDFPGNFVEFLKEKTASGAAEVRHIKSGEEIVGYLVFAVITAPHFESEILVYAMAGKDGSDLTEQVAPHVKALALELGCKFIRFHTMRAGLVKKAKALGFHVSEIILRQRIN